MRNWQKPGLISKWALIMVGSLAICQAQPEFEVASVKPAANPEGRALIQALPGRLTMTNLALRRLILIAMVSRTINSREIRPGLIPNTTTFRPKRAALLLCSKSRVRCFANFLRPVSN